MQSIDATWLKGARSVAIRPWIFARETVVMTAAAPPAGTLWNALAGKPVPRRRPGDFDQIDHAIDHFRAHCPRTQRFLGILVFNVFQRVWHDECRISSNLVPGSLAGIAFARMRVTRDSLHPRDWRGGKQVDRASGARTDPGNSWTLQNLTQTFAFRRLPQKAFLRAAKTGAARAVATSRRVERSHMNRSRMMAEAKLALAVRYRRLPPANPDGAEGMRCIVAPPARLAGWLDLDQLTARA